MTDEVRITSLTGGEKGQKDARLGGGDPLALLELARVYGFGEKKYARYNYLKGYDWSLSIDALLRHLMAFLAGEERDPETGLLHTAHLAWHGLTLTSFQLRHAGTDDRAPKLPIEGTALPSEDHGRPFEYNCQVAGCVINGHKRPATSLPGLCSYEGCVLPSGHKPRYGNYR